MTTTDARKRNRDMADAHETARARDARVGAHDPNCCIWCRDGQPVDWPAFDEVQPPTSTRTHAINPDTGEFTRLDQEDTMTDHRIAAESLLDGELEDHADVSTLTSAAAHALLAIHDTLKDIAGNTAEQYAVLTEIRDRLPERPTFHDLDDVAAPADDLPGEPVAPGDLRAGDRVAFTWEVTGERIPCTLVSVQGLYILRSDVPDSDGYCPNVVYRSEWGSGISDVRLIERAPADVDPDITFPFRGGWLAEGRYAEGEEKALPLSAKVAEADLARVTEERDGWRRRVEAVVEYFRIHPGTELVPYNVARRIQWDVLDGHADERAES